MGRYNTLNGQLLYSTIQTIYMTICLPLSWFSVIPATRYFPLTWRQPCKYGKHSSHNLIHLTSVCGLKGESVYVKLWAGNYYYVMGGITIIATKYNTNFYSYLIPD